MATRASGNPVTLSLFKNFRTHFRSCHYASNASIDSISQFEQLVRTRCNSSDLTVTEALGYSDSMLVVKPMASFQTVELLFGSLFKLNQFSTVVSLYTHLTRLRFHEFEPNVSTMTLVFKCLCRLNCVELGFSVLGTALKRGIGYNSHTLCTLLDELCKQGSMVAAIELFAKMESEVGSCNQVCYGILINVFFKAGESQKALEILKLLLEKDGIKLDIYSFNSIINFLCRDGLIDEALSLFRCMIDRGVWPNIICYNTLINRLCKSRKWNDVVLILVNMKAHKVSPNVVTFNCILDALFKEGDTLVALHLIGVMAEKRLFPDKIASSTFLSGLCNANRPKDAKILCDNIENLDVRADTYTLNILLNGLSTGFMILEAQQLFGEMIEHGQFNKFTFTAMLNGYCLLGKMEKAKDVFNQMEINGVFPDTVAYNILARGYFNVQRVEYALKILKDLILKGLQPNDVTRSILKIIQAKKREDFLDYTQ